MVKGNAGMQISCASDSKTRQDNECEMEVAA